MRDRQSEERSHGAAARERLVLHACFRERPLRGQRHDRVDARIDALDLREVCAHDVGDGKITRSNAARQLGGGDEAELSAHASIVKRGTK